jgi:hypothetical protein
LAIQCKLYGFSLGPSYFISFLPDNLDEFVSSFPFSVVSGRVEVLAEIVFSKTILVLLLEMLSVSIFNEYAILILCVILDLFLKLSDCCIYVICPFIRGIVVHSFMEKLGSVLV